MLIIHDFTLTFVIMSEIHHFMSQINSVVCFCHEQFCTLNIFFMHNFVWMTFNIIIDFRHAHIFTNDYPYSFGFSACTFLYEWLFILFLYGFSSCTFLYEWLSIFLCVFVIHIFLRMTIHIILVYVFVMLVFVRMTIHILMGFRHVHVCTNDYPFRCA